MKRREMDTAAEMTVYQKVICEISPTKAVSACSMGKNKKVIATPEAKTIAVKASIGNFVLISNNQIKTIPKITKGKAVKETLKSYSKARAIPGSVKWPSGPATRAILLLNIREPIYPAAPPIKIPAVKLNES